MAFIHTTITEQDFKTSNYFHNHDCALAKTLNRVIDLPFTVHCTSATIGGEIYKITDNLSDTLLYMCYRDFGDGVLAPRRGNSTKPKNTPILIDTINKTISVDEKEQVN